jgi:hypothetical protein
MSKWKLFLVDYLIAFSWRLFDYYTLFPHCNRKVSLHYILHILCHLILFRTRPFTCTNLNWQNSLYPRIICPKFYWMWPAGSGDWLIIYDFTSRSRIFHLYGDVTIAGEGLQNLGLCSALRTFEQGGIFIVPHLLWHGTSVFPVSSEGPPHLAASYDTRGRRKIHKFFSAFLLFCYYLPLEKGDPLHLNKLETPPPKNDMCQVWLKLAKWFRRSWKCKSLQTDNRRLK